MLLLRLRPRLLDAGGAELQTNVLENLAIAKSGSGRLHLHRAAAHATASLRSARPELKRLTVVVTSGAAANSSGSQGSVRNGPPVFDSQGAEGASGGPKTFRCSAAAVGGAPGRAPGPLGAEGHAARSGRTPQGAQRGRRRGRNTSTGRLACPSSSRNCARAAALIERPAWKTPEAYRGRGPAWDPALPHRRLRRYQGPGDDGQGHVPARIPVFRRRGPLQVCALHRRAFA